MYYGGFCQNESLFRLRGTDRAKKCKTYAGVTGSAVYEYETNDDIEADLVRIMDKVINPKKIVINLDGQGKKVGHKKKKPTFTEI